MSIGQALANPKVLLWRRLTSSWLRAAMASSYIWHLIVKDWYDRDVKEIGNLIIIPAIGALIGQLLIGWNSDRIHERRWHASLPIILGAVALAMIPGTKVSTLWFSYHALHSGNDRHESILAGLLGTAQSVLDRVSGGGVASG